MKLIFYKNEKIQQVFFQFNETIINSQHIEQGYSQYSQINKNYCLYFQVLQCFLLYSLLFMKSNFKNINLKKVTQLLQQFHMKLLLAFVVLILTTQSYDLWDNWHNVPSTFSHPWTSNSSSTYVPPNVSGWVRNAITPQSYFSDYSFRASQYLSYLSSDNTNLAFCGPKSYLYGNGTLCQRDPFYWNTSSSSIKQFCYPDSYGSNAPGGGYGECDSSNFNPTTYPCCYLQNSAGITDINYVDPYTTPLF